MDLRQPASSLQWESNITAFAILHGTGYMYWAYQDDNFEQYYSINNYYGVFNCFFNLVHRYVGDEYGMVSVLNYSADEGKLVQLPYYVPTDALSGMGFLFQCFD